MNAAEMCMTAMLTTLGGNLYVLDSHGFIQRGELLDVASFGKEPRCLCGVDMRKDLEVASPVGMTNRSSFSHRTPPYKEYTLVA